MSREALPNASIFACAGEGGLKMWVVGLSNVGQNHDEPSRAKENFAC